jgi:SAM-dependent methyltransferase
MPRQIPEMLVHDASNGWNAIAEGFISTRAISRVGANTISAWSTALPTGGSVLDLGCGAGVPITEALVARGFAVHGIDASPVLAAAYAQRFPQCRVACEDAESSPFFHRTFDGIVAWGLLFLLTPASQRRLLTRVASALAPGGRFLFTAPVEVGTWDDISTGHLSYSLGDTQYRSALMESDLVIVEEYIDEAENHYYDVCRRDSRDSR